MYQIPTESSPLCIVTLSFPYAYFIDLDLLGGGEPFAFRALDYQDQYCFLFSFPLGCQKYPGKVSDSCISLSELGFGLETRGKVSN